MYACLLKKKKTNQKKKAVTVYCQGLSGSFVEINDISNCFPGEVVWIFLFAYFPSHALFFTAVT